ncbi:CAF17-like 4Fe-4S cluster assembly/insertion protein YgfZ [Candidatus Fokinia crypta]|uniref:YgfZ-like protein n=1 Tax=Candidatus Fokinia crypta TaxID=1920990 RepID=A0ABZ0UPX9_9RICK|nr:hypothetical protein [Candidatus Fokinia cryptica]WPX97947.1 YgfZ-like protein [Candidatus Fokinia cryptica]
MIAKEVLLVDERRTVLSVCGLDASTFLQNMLTNDVHEASCGKAVYAFLLSPRGKILYDFFLYKDSDECFTLDVSSKFLEKLLLDMKKYVLRSNVDIKHEKAFVILSNEPFNLNDYCNCIGKNKIFNKCRISHYSKDPRGTQLWFRGIMSTNIEVASSQHEKVFDSYFMNYSRILFQNRIPSFGNGFYSDEFYPHEMGFSDIGVSYTKGCFIGQEITTRVKFLGNSKKKIVLLNIPSYTSSFDYSGNTERLSVYYKDKLVGTILEEHKDGLMCLMYDEERYDNTELKICKLL